MEDRRKLPRYVFGASGKLSAPEGGATSDVSVLVLSIEGALIECRNPPEVGQKFTLNIEWEGFTTTVTAEVRSREKSGAAGMMFLGVDAASSERLKQICAGLPLEGRGPSVEGQK